MGPYGGKDLIDVRIHHGHGSHDHRGYGLVSSGDGTHPGRRGVVFPDVDFVHRKAVFAQPPAQRGTERTTRPPVEHHTARRVARHIAPPPRSPDTSSLILVDRTGGPGKSVRPLTHRVPFHEHGAGWAYGLGRGRTDTTGGRRGEDAASPDAHRDHGTRGRRRVRAGARCGRLPGTASRGRGGHALRSLGNGTAGGRGLAGGGRTGPGRLPGRPTRYGSSSGTRSSTTPSTAYR